ncbi:MAG: glycoside hydrolase family 2 protein [Phycisphaerales bacterium]
MPPLRQSLDRCPWRVRSHTPDAPAETRRWIDAQVPGCAHLDLIRAGVIGDPAIGFNELDQFWVGKADWEYRTRFHADERLFAHERIDLVCDGLDTIATLELNGERIGEAANMFHPHRFNVREALKRTGANELLIRFRSPLRHVREEQARLGARPVNGDWDPYIFIRKAACNFGWDWGPKVPTVGIWKPIRLEGWSGARIVSLRPLVTRADQRLATVEVHVDVERGNHLAELVIEAMISEKGEPEALSADAAMIDGDSAALRLEVSRPSLWWPRGHGKQPLYEVTVSLRASKGARPRILDRDRGTIGLRTVRLNTETDRWGSKFQFEVNGKPIFCQGANWIPDDLFPTRVTPRRLRQRVRQAADANMNMLRVWGGGYYEHDAFYDACDRAGIMVWQDFMFACAMYPEEPPYPALIEAEARHQVSRLSSHPCVVLWCGGNECVWGWQKWGWKDRLKPGQTWGAGYYFDLLPKVVKELCPTTPYWANSPLSANTVPAALERDVLDPNHGDRHTWDATFEEYRARIPRFVSEFGQQSPASLPTLRRAIGASGLRVDSEAIKHRQRATGGNAAMYDTALSRAGQAPTDFAQWHRMMQRAQADAVRIAFEWAVANQPRCMGALVWQLNDCWPALSWSLIDSAGKPKPAYFAVKRALAVKRAAHPR